jgi:hypothetical protein
MKTTIEKRRVTVYFLGGLGYVKKEASAFGHQVSEYAQYEAAVRFAMVEKGHRKPVGVVQTYKPSLVVLDGWGHPDPDGAWTDSAHGEQVSRHVGFDDAWSAEFDAKLDAYIASGRGKVVCDYRNHDTK